MNACGCLGVAVLEKKSITEGLLPELDLKVHLALMRDTKLVFTDLQGLGSFHKENYHNKK